MSKLECRGIGVIIDDQVPLSPKETTSDYIANIVNHLQEDGIPLLKYKTIPPESEWPNLENVAFFLIDWYWDSSGLDVHDPLAETIRNPDVPMSAIGDKICKFIKAVHQKAFAPIFVFSNQGDTDSKQCLTDNGIAIDVPGAYVFIKNKKDMIDLDEDGNPRLFSEINTWIRATPTIHLLTTWGRDVLAAKNQMFAEFYDKSHNWPSLLWKAYKDDGDDPAQGLSQVMFDNLKARVKCGVPEMPDVGQDERALASLPDILALTVMLPSSSLPQKQIGCGDLFKVKSGKLYLVVSCDCDCVVHKGESAESTFVQVVKVNGGCDPESEKMANRFSIDYGFLHQSNQSYLFPINGKCYCVSYPSFSIVPLSELKLDKRIGRILPPYITDVRQRLAQWNQREGFPKLPPELFPAVNNQQSMDKKSPEFGGTAEQVTHKSLIARLVEMLKKIMRLCPEQVRCLMH